VEDPRLHLTLACNVYDRTLPILTGRVVPDGVRLNAIASPIEETFWRQLRFQEFDVSEMSLSAHAMLTSRGNSPWVGLPVFLSRVFRHSCIYVRRGAGIREPADLAGRRVGVPEYHMTAGVYVRGLLQDEYGVDLDGVTWFTGGQDEPGRRERVDLPPEVRVHPIGPGRTLGGMLVEGEIDALVTARMPAVFLARDGRVERLFPDYPRVEEEYYRRTRIFPIMHLLVVRRSLAERHPWLPMSLYKAFRAAKEEVLREMYDINALRVSLPWVVPEMERTRAVFGDDWWPYGLEPSRPTLEAFCRYMREQRLVARPLAPEELFAPQTLEESRI
jgi:4,5-dihydroxyphthalate decarboxylase